MNVADLLLFLIPIAAGMVAGVVTNWALRARVFSLEDRIAVLEGVQTREVKIRAAMERGKRPSALEQTVLEKLEAPLPPPRVPNWWELPNVQRSAGGK